MKNRCARCGKRLKRVGPSYVIKAELISHFDGYISYNDKKDLAAEISRLNEKMENMGQSEIERQIYEKFEYLVCPICRDEIGDFLRISEEIT